MGGKQKGLGFIPLQLSFLFNKVVVCGHCLVTLSLTINETIKRLLLLPVLMQESFWWWQCSDMYMISLSPHLHSSFPLFSLSLTSRIVSVDVKHHVYLLTWNTSIFQRLSSLDAMWLWQLWCCHYWQRWLVRQKHLYGPTPSHVPLKTTIFFKKMWIHATRHIIKN